MKKYIYFLSSILLILSCSEITDITIPDENEVRIALPIIDSSVKINDFLEDIEGETIVNVDEDGKITVVYNGSVTRISLNDIFLNSLPIIAIPILDSVYAVDDLFKEDQLVTRAIANTSSTMVIGIENDRDVPLVVDVHIPDLIRNGEEFRDTYNVNPSSTSISEKFDIAGDLLLPFNNTIRVNYDARTPEGERVLVDDFTIVFESLNFEFITGYLGNDQFDVVGDFITLNIFDSWINGEINLEDPKINIDVDNSLGFPIKVIVNQIKFTNINDETISLISDVLNDGIDINYPSIDEVGTIKRTSFSFDKDNSNIRDLINTKTSMIDFDIDAIANPENDTTILGFAEHDSYFEVLVNAELPVFGSVTDLVLRDTLDYEIDDLENVSHGDFKLKIKNNFPADMDLNIYILDSQGNRLSQLIDGGIRLNAAIIDPEGKISIGTDHEILFEKDQDDIDIFIGGSHLMVEFKMTTGEEGLRSLWIYDSYGVDIKLGGIFNYKIQQ